MARKSFTLVIEEADKDIFEAIKKGTKKVETRAATPKYREVDAEDELVFVCGKKKLSKIVASAHVFKTIEGLLKEYKVKDINPALKTEKELKKMWAGFPGYPAKIRKHGVIAFELE